MRIEILTRNMEKKTEILTLLGREPGLEAAGTKVKADGLQMTAGEDYLLFLIESWERAQQIIPLLFSILPGAYAPSSFEPVTDQKILVTAAAQPLTEIIGNLNALEHLDLEAGELSGKFQVQWRSRDIAVSAFASLVVQGGVATAKIKFAGHFRDSEQHCRKVLESISLPEILTVFTPEISFAPPPPLIKPTVIEKQATLKENNWDRILNCFPAEIIYLPESDEYRAYFDPASYLAIQNKKGSIELSVHIENPVFLTTAVINHLNRLAGIEEVTVKKAINRLTIDPESLLRQLGFQKEKGFHLFAREEIFRAVYDIRERELRMEAVVSFAADNIEKRLAEIYRAMDLLASEAQET